MPYFPSFSRSLFVNCPRLATLLSNLASLIDANILTWGDVTNFATSFQAPPDGITILTEGELREASGRFWGACKRRFGHRAYQIGNGLLDRIRAGLITADHLERFVTPRVAFLHSDHAFSAQL